MEDVRDQGLVGKGSSGVGHLFVEKNGNHDGDSSSPGRTMPYIGFLLGTFVHFLLPPSTSDEVPRLGFEARGLTCPGERAVQDHELQLE